MTERLYYADSYLTEFEARVVDSSDSGLRVYLDRSAFYPTSGGQPFDRGELGGVVVVDVIDEGERVAHVLARALTNDRVHGRVDWNRRFDHMQQHTGQHVLSAVFEDLFGLATISVHFGDAASTLDLDVGVVEMEQILEAERRANQIALSNHPVGIYFEDASAVQGLRKPPPERSGRLRVVEIAGVDRSACGGTHVRAASEIGPILIRKLDRVRKSARVEFVCGMRALRQARADFAALSAVARALSCSHSDAPAIVAEQAERLVEAERALRRLTAERLAQRARSLHAAAQPDDAGVRRALLRAPATEAAEDLRTLAQEFSRLPSAVLVVVTDSPAGVLVAASEDSGLDAAAMLKQALAAVGGRGGGSARVAQGRVVSSKDAELVVRGLLGGAPAPAADANETVESA